MNDPSIRQRKLDHVDLALNDEASSGASAGWSDVTLVPVALPDLALAEVDSGIRFLGHDLRAPVMIAGMTGGHPNLSRINAALATAAAEHGIAMGVGSQRAALLDPELVPSYAIVRQQAPKAFICGNIGISQVLNGDAGPDILRQIVDMVKADALAIHINVLQELIQPEGEIDTARACDALAKVVDDLPVPVIIKETGCGVDRETAHKLAQSGIAAIDVGGMGGTSFTRIEGVRAKDAGDQRGARLGRTFANWGIPTACSILEIRDAGLPVIATGGISDGLQAAKALALGASLTGIGRQMLVAAMDGPEAAVAELGLIIEEIKISLGLCNCRNLVEFAARQPILSGDVASWADRNNKQYLEGAN